MKQYHELLNTIKEKGSYKEAAREGIPGTLSRFGYQFRVDLSEGFPLLTTKKLSFKNIVVELLWFLRGDTNIKYLIDNGCNIWNEDAYNYYCKKCKEQGNQIPMNFDEFIKCVKDENNHLKNANLLDVGLKNYKIGDCGFQYGRVWREWQGEGYNPGGEFGEDGGIEHDHIDQLSKVIENIKTKPYDRRKVITAVDPAHDEDLALYWCHCLFQFNCRKLSDLDRKILLSQKEGWEDQFHLIDEDPSGDIMDVCDELNIPKYYLDCQLYQRSADVFLGVPYNIASYALLIHIVAKICNMVPGEFIHTFGDVHIYDNHKEQVDEQLSRELRELPKIHVLERHKDHGTHPDHFEKYLTNRINLDQFLKSLQYYDFRLEGYDPHPAIKAELSTGMKK